MKEANYVIKYFKGRWFSGALEDYMGYMITYFNQFAMPFSLKVDETEIFFPHSLEALEIYLLFENGNQIMTYEDISSLMEADYDLAPRKSTVQN